MTDPWDYKTPRMRLAISYGQDPATGKQALGWTVMGLAPPILDKGEDPVVGSHLETALRRYKEMIAAHPGCEGITLHRYESETFAGSRAAREGMTLQQHHHLIDRLARALAAKGIDVRIERA